MGLLSSFTDSPGASGENAPDDGQGSARNESLQERMTDLPGLKHNLPTMIPPEFLDHLRV